MQNKLNEARKNLHNTTGELNYYLEIFGDKLAKKQKYTEINGIEAIWLYLIKTYHWTPAYVKSMNLDDIRFVLTEELHSFRVKNK